MKKKTILNSNLFQPGLLTACQTGKARGYLPTKTVATEASYSDVKIRPQPIAESTPGGFNP